MKVIYGIGQFKKKLKNTVLAIGVFDGVHIGHQELLKKALAKADEIKGKVVVMTFHPHPVHVLYPEKSQPLIDSIDYRCKVLEKLGVAACVIVKFTKRFAQMSPQNFIRRYLKDAIAPQEVFVGDDFRFGQDRSGTLDYFIEAGKSYGFNVNVFRSVQSGIKKIGSSRIRELILNGQLKAASKFLGRNVSVMGRVVKGDGRGRTIGYPTANIRPQNEILPPRGVYAVNVLIDGQCLPGMANVGIRPSFKNNQDQILIEAHIFDFDASLYGQMIIVEFKKKIRNEKKFSSPKALIAQLRKDEEVVRKISL